MSDFVIENGVLKKYTGEGGDVVIPEGVTEIGEYAFSWCKNLQSIVIPKSVTKIGSGAFYECKNLKKIELPKNITAIRDYTFYNCEKLQRVVIPEGVTEIGKEAFYDCRNLRDIVIPKGVTEIVIWTFCHCEKLQSVVISEGTKEISYMAFYGCKKLQSVTLPTSLEKVDETSFDDCPAIKHFDVSDSKCKISMFFGEDFPKNLIGEVAVLHKNMTDGAVKNYLLKKKNWSAIDMDVKYDVFFTHQGKSLDSPYGKVISDDEAKYFGEKILASISEKASLKECNFAAKFLLLLGAKISDDLINKIYAELKKQKNAAKAIKSIEEDVSLSERLGKEPEIDDSLPEAEQKIQEILLAEKTSIKGLEAKFKEYYGLTAKDITPFYYKDGTKVSSVVSEWLLTAHEEICEHAYSPSDVVAGYKNPGICPEAKEILEFIDEKSFQNALLTLANENLGITGRSKKMFLAYPICRYADTDLMSELTKRAPKWSSYVSGNDAPSLYTFRKAAMYSNERSAMFFAERYHELKKYAKIHGTNEDTIRDKYLSETGLDEKGEKEYDLGNQKVIAKLQDDLDIIFIQENGKTSKSLPKKGADEEKYNTAKKDFDEIKKAVKKIVKNRGDVLFEEFLSGKKKTAKSWKDSYTQNPLLRKVATLLVWKQGNSTFTLNDSGAITSDGAEYVLSDKPVSVAHPMEMNADDLHAWQKYFVSHGLKQPFEQVWEPVIDPSSIKEDRYGGCMIPYYRFLGREKHGITVQDFNYHDDIIISFDGCYADIKRIDLERHAIDMNDRFEVKTFSFKKYSRMINHIVAYLDKITAYDRIAKDDISVESVLPGFTLAQITEFIKIAQENNATNVTALLLNFKNENFGDFDPMAEFTLD